MATIHPQTNVVTRSGAARERWHPLQAGLLGVGLAVLAVVMYLGAAPGGAAHRPPPSASTTDEEAAVARSLPSPPARQHLVLLVSDPELGAAVQRRILAGEVVADEFGANAAPLVVEVLVADDAASMAAITAGLREFEAQCVAEACAAIRVLDLRAARLPE